MATTARQALRAFLDQLLDAQKDHPATADDYAIVAAGAPGVPDLNDSERKIHNVLDLRTAICLPKFTEGFVFIPDPRNGGLDQAIHDQFRDLNNAANQEQSDESVTQ